MAPALAALIAPAHTAVLTMEMQRGVSGDLAMMAELADLMAADGVIEAIAAIAGSARSHGVRVVHCTVETRPDGAGRADNCRLLAATAAGADAMTAGSAPAEVVPEIGVTADDIVLARLHGLTPFTGTSLDQILRNLSVTTVVATGNSLNVGVLGMVISAVDLGYQVVVPRDAVAGLPRDYAEAVLTNTIGLLATVTTSAELIDAWS